jgi:hypothetical protein
MMLGNRLAHGPRPAVDHQPQASFLIGLKFQEVVAPAQGRKLDPAVPVRELRQRRVAQRGLVQSVGKSFT